MCLEGPSPTLRRMLPFTVQFYKYPDRLHWRHDMVRLGEDRHGVWVGLRSGGGAGRLGGKMEHKLGA